MTRTRFHKKNGFTLIELLVVIGIMAILIALALPVYSSTMDSARASASSSNLSELAAANLAYSNDHDGYYCPAQDVTNNLRWHGARTSSSGTFDPSKGYLSPYLGGEGRVKLCPLFANMLTGASSFENGTGGYGYNAAYIGGTPANWLQPIKVANVPRPSMTVMFTTTAFPKANGLQEYAFCEPYTSTWGATDPSVHFRAHGRALVAWCDGHVSAELPTQLGGVNSYGGDSAKAKIGWFGPSDQNGYWNPAYTGP